MNIGRLELPCELVFQQQLLMTKTVDMSISNISSVSLMLMSLLTAAAQ